MTDKDFIINAGPQGTFKRSGHFQTLPEDVDALFSRWAAEVPGKISIYFHGGLVGERSGLDTARKMADNITMAGNAPVCFVWETGLIETISTNLVKIGESKLFGKVLNVVLKKLSEKLGFDAEGGRGGGRMLTDEEIDAELNQPAPFAEGEWRQVPAMVRGGDTLTALPDDPEDLQPILEGEYTLLVDSDPEFIEAISETEVTPFAGQAAASRGVISSLALVKHLAAISIRVIKRFFKKTDHGFYPTIIEELLREFYIAEIGAWVWNSMKIKAADLWKDNSTKSGLSQYAGRYFLDKLIAFRKQFPETKVNLIGHSAGSIAICNLLKTMYSDEVPEADRFVFHKILFLAPACRCDLFNNEIVLHPERFGSFRMFTMMNDTEKKDRLVPFFYTHSLLYLISGILEGEGKEPDAFVLGLERHINGEAPYDDDPLLQSIHRFLYPPTLERLILSITSVTNLGFTTTATAHGAFDDNVETINSIKFLIQ